MKYTKIVLVIFALQSPILFAIVNITPGGTFSIFGGQVSTASQNSQIGALIPYDGGEVSHIDGVTKITSRSKVDEIYVDGVRRFRGNGRLLNQKLIIQQQNNRLEGDLVLAHDVDFQDASVTATFAGTRRLDKNINLNGGALLLEEDINFNSDRRINGPGKVTTNGRRLTFGSKDFTYSTSLYFDNASSIECNGNMTLSSIWTFSGSQNRISGKGFVLTLGTGGTIIIERGSTLILDGIVIDGVTTDNMYCKDNAGTLILKDTGWLQSSTYTFSVGSLQIKDRVTMSGESTFVYQSPMLCTVNRNAKLLLDNNFTFSYDTLSSDRLRFVDSSSLLIMDFSNFFIGYPGLVLTKGTMVASNQANVFVDRRSLANTSSGLFMGDNVGNDMTLNILSGSVFNLKSGRLTYRNVNSSSINLLSGSSEIYLEPQTVLAVDKTMYMGRGSLVVNKLASIEYTSEEGIDGSMAFIK